MELEWLRFRNWRGAGGFRELAVRGKTVYLRKWTIEANAKLERFDFATEREASNHAAQLVAKILKAGFEKEHAVKRWLSDKEGTPGAKAAARRAVSETNARKSAGYREALREAGIADGLTFLSQTKTLDEANALVRRCLSLAARVFEVSFSEAELVKDREHGVWRATPVTKDELALFYRSPARVAEIAEQKLRGQLRDSDGQRRGTPPARRPKQTSLS